jgi:RNA polymerase sigma-70 factor, ECF subfamily
MASGWFMSGSTVTEAPASDLDLVRRMAGGDESAAAVLYDRYGTVLYAVVYRIVGQRADAEEVVMEAFAQAWREATRFEAGRGSVAAWLTMISRSRALDQIRSRERRDRLATTAAREDEAQAPAMGAWGSDPGYQVEQSERQRRVAAALDALSPAQREAIELAYYDGLSQSEIAERLNEPLGTIKTRVRLGMMKLREALRPYYYEPAV